MPDTFMVNLPKNWEQRWPELQRAARKYDFWMEKKGPKIAFNGYGIQGSITISGSKALIIIDKKPFFLSQSIIEDRVRQFLTDYA